MLTKAEAEAQILRQWRKWARKSNPPTENEKMAFYVWLKDTWPDMLEFQFYGDKWQQVRAWLNRALR